MTIETGSGLNYRFDFPVPGINQSSKPFRDNFQIIKVAVENLQTANSQENAPLSLLTAIQPDGSIIHNLTFQTSGFALPTGEITPMQDGRIRYNPSLKRIEFTADGIWQPISSGEGGGGGGASTFTGDVTGSGIGTIPLTLSNSGVSSGTYSTVVVDVKGRVTSGSDLTLTGDVVGTGSGTINTQLLYISPGAEYSKVTTDDYGRVVAGVLITDDIEVIQFACSDETTVLTAGTNVLRLHFPYSFTITNVRATLNGASITGQFKVDMKIAGVSMLADGLVIDEGFTSSKQSLVQPELLDRFGFPTTARDVFDDSLLAVDILEAGSGAFGLKLIIYGYKNPNMLDPDIE